MAEEFRVIMDSDLPESFDPDLIDCDCDDEEETHEH